jgi:hypothetical protein
VAYVVTNPEYLELAGVPLSTPGWEMTDASDLWASAEVRGGDLVIPGATGVRPYRRRPTVTKATVELAVFGDTSWDGTAYPSVRAGLATNCRHLEALAQSPATTDGTVLAVLHYAPGAPAPDRRGPVHVLRVRFARIGPNLATGQVELSIPAGALA